MQVEIDYGMPKNKGRTGLACIALVGSAARPSIPTNKQFCFDLGVHILHSNHISCKPYRSLLIGSRDKLMLGENYWSFVSNHLILQDQQPRIWT